MTRNKTTIAIICLIIILIFLASCVKPPTFSEDEANATTKETVKSAPKNVTKTVSNKTIEKTVKTNQTTTNSTTTQPENGTQTIETTEPATPVEPPKPENRIDVTPGASSSSVISTMDGVTKKFNVPDVDHDAIVFDISQELGRGVREIKPWVFINGVAYMRPSERQKAIESQGTVIAATFNISQIPIIETKEDGFIRAVGCDLENGYIRIELTNPTETTVPIFESQAIMPRVKGALVLSLNRRPLEKMACTGNYSIEPGKNNTCVKTNVAFIGGGSHTQFETNASYDLSKPDMASATRPGHQESVSFYCSAKS